ncbi:unnamed protein product [Aphanomyces euteiches]|uniref:BD-FAE-like domain-containing protein n=1 Tax=Aphanomyces euteiches TaxID=100861 RepID=A0A6G0WZF9_9STRA|nr:hypothetical protein Ae201684_010061 [Aphanomyces euteiches]KAH9134119.1 hypothetical protein AeRB84_020012 [Aphanomyces euteiches]
MMMRKSVDVGRRFYYMWRNIPYTKQAHPLQILDVVVPRQPPFPRSQLPVVVFVHGGAWQRGHKDGKFYANVAPTIAELSGSVVVKVNYRLSPEVQYPEHVRDVLHAVQWIHDEIHQYGGDKDQIILMGHSAGAHAIVKLAMDPISFSNCPKLAGVIGISGVYNILRLSQASIFGSLVLDPAFGENVKSWREASVMQPTCPATTDLPVLLMHASEDFHFHEDALELKTWLETNGYAHVNVKEIPDCNHLSIIGNVNADDPMSPTTQAICDFIKKISTK